MGGLIGGIFDLTSGDPTANEGHQLAGLSGFETGTGEGLETAGAGFDESLLSGDPTKIASTLAPEISTGQQQVEQAALRDANFGNRSGGTNATTQNAEAKNRGNIIDLEGGLQSGAASSALGAGSGLLGQASSNINDKASLDAANRQRVVGDVNGIAQSAAEIATGFGGGTPSAAATPQPWYPNAMQDAGNAVPLETDDEVGADPFGWGIQ